MRYYRQVKDDKVRLVAREDSKAFDLTSVHPEIQSLTDLLAAAKITDRTVDDIVDFFTVKADSTSIDGLEGKAILPVVPDEIWAAGVTYEISEKARQEESTLPEIYRKVYDSERPELFFKATASRTVGPRESIGIRNDSDWNVPEPELALVLFEGSIVGYTIGNDVSSREIEGENPLYLPQAKVYDRCCAIGPCIATGNSIPDAHDLEITMTIHRDGGVVYDDSTSTANMVRTCEELVSFHRRSNTLPRVSILMTGTSLVPEEVSIQAGDEVEIEIESIGRLRNPVVEV